MSGERTHAELEELLGAYALDAVAPDEAAALEAHLAGCPRCRAEVDAHREVAGALGNTVDPLPPGLWDAIAGRLDEDGEVRAPVVPIGTPPPRRRTARWVVAAVGAAAVVAVAALSIGLVQADRQNGRLQDALGRQTSAVAAAQAAPGHLEATLTSTGGSPAARFVLRSDGRGYLVDARLPALSAGRTYQLWGLYGGTPISLGLLGPSPTAGAFTAARLPGSLAITVEPARGSTTPSLPLVASGPVRRA